MLPISNTLANQIYNNPQSSVRIPQESLINLWKHDVQIVAELRDPKRPMKRKRSDFVRSEFFPKVERDANEKIKEMVQKFDKILKHASEIKDMKVFDEAQKWMDAQNLS